MVKLKDSQAAYDLLKLCLENPRIKKKKIREEISPYKTYVGTRNFMERIRQEGIIYGPELWINSGFVVELVKSRRKSCLDLFEDYKKDDQTTYVIALIGDYSLLYFRRGASILKNAICVIPSFPARKRIPEIQLVKKGIIERAEYPNNWDDFDWKVFNSMESDPNRSFGIVGGELGVSWTTVQTHFKKILRDSAIWVSFFPQGYSYYQQALLKFKTEYEKNLIKELEKIDRSSFLYKYDDNLLLLLYYEDYRDLQKFELLKKEGKISDLSFSIPIAWD
ncbi:MAG: hypothetical protein HXS46_02190 [Theionarchaea archaeon]|nr:MAG: hypothetical protein AYK18_14090 [Theionarchaea archaeon DG-70]MBU7009473.1 hypothetical protein [Theionarchaea archaeon]